MDIDIDIDADIDREKDIDMHIRILGLGTRTGRWQTRNKMVECDCQIRWWQLDGHSQRPTRVGDPRGRFCLSWRHLVSWTKALQTEYLCNSVGNQ